MVARVRAALTGLVAIALVVSTAPSALDDSYTLDAVGSPTTITHNAGPGGGTSDAYAYDDQDRLTGVCYGAASCTGQAGDQAGDYVRWTYDPVGNRTSEVRPGGTSSYHYDPTTGRLASVDPASGPTRTYQYDARGNLTSNGTDLFTYTGAGMTATATRDLATTTFAYDGDGRRLSTTSPTDQTTGFQWDPVSYQLLAETGTGTGGSGGSGGVVREYDYGIGELGVTDAGGPDTGPGGSTGTISYLHTDLQSSVRAVTTATGAITQSATYEPFGILRASSGTTGTPAAVPLGYAGQYADPGGQSHLRARQYDPTTGAFTAPDPEGGPAVGDNYAYAAANPMVNEDPMGTWPSLNSIKHAVVKYAPVVGMVATALSFTPLAPIAAPIALIADGITAYSAADDLYHQFQNPKGADGSAVFGDLLTLGGSVVGLGGLGKAGSKLPSRGAKELDELGEGGASAAKACSFAGATLVLMADGSKKPIDQIKVGDLVMATDPETGERAAKRVKNVLVHGDSLTDLKLADGTVLTTTEDHPYWSVDDKRFERADELTRGERVLSADGRTIKVTGLQRGTSHEGLAYNLTIEGIHTYHVGYDTVLVHNTCKWVPKKPGYTENKVVLSSRGAAEQAARDAAAVGGRCRFRGLCGSGNHYHVDYFDKIGQIFHTTQYRFPQH